MGLMNIIMFCPNCDAPMRIFKGKLGDDIIEFKCPKCGNVEQRTSTPVQGMAVETSTTGEQLCSLCVNNKMCRVYQQVIRTGHFITKCNHYVKRSHNNL
jgi:predicted Zn finger-like uncharacterized protein